MIRSSIFRAGIMRGDVSGPLSMQSSAPASLSEFRDRHAGESILVCGCGSSLSAIPAPERFVTIGVNDVGRLFDPDYLVVLNSRHQFTGDRFRYVENSRAKAIFSQLDLGIRHPHQVRFRLGVRGGTELSNSESLPYTRNSPYLAVCLALFMGARRIGLMGVDFTDHHFFAQTGRHILANNLPHIDREYGRLFEKCARDGVEIFNLSAESRLTSLPKMSPEDFARGGIDNHFAGRRVFFVNYRFLSCGSVFHDGLAHAANDLGLAWRAADWDEPALEQNIAAFRPELLFVVHGRKFSSRRLALPQGCRTAVWLLDEPYEVDDTSRFSSSFDIVFVNDAGTLHRHKNAVHLPVCYDPHSHTCLPGAERPHAVGFVGGANPRREEALTRLARKGCLSYVVGSAWRSSELNRLCLAANVPASRTAELYRNTRVVLNVFRSQHHFNRAGIAATDLNPRIFEALACGALVISEHRSALDTVCPDLPVFTSFHEMETLIERSLQEPDWYAAVRKACIRALAPHTYSNRLATVLRTAMEQRAVFIPPPSRPDRSSALEEWEVDSTCVSGPDGVRILRAAGDPAPGSERGLRGTVSSENVNLEFEVFLQPDTCFIAKIHQAHPHNQLANSYHLMCQGPRGYLARHDHVLQNLTVPVGRWLWVLFSYRAGSLIVRFDGVEVARKTDRLLKTGYCFLGVKEGEARVRQVSASADGDAAEGRIRPYRILRSPVETPNPMVSIVTTVFDRVECLARCLRSVEALGFRSLEQIVVADRPADHVVEQLAAVIDRSWRHPISFAILKARRNDWGISPAAAGLSLARGRYICFLSDDNGYLPHHFDRLVETLEGEPRLGFAYSSCQYDGRMVLNNPSPQPARIDLGQPLFRRELFEKYLNGTLPFHEFGWDWRMIERFLQKGVRWKHIDDPTFIFRLAQYPHLLAPESTPIPVR